LDGPKQGWQCQGKAAGVQPSVFPGGTFYFLLVPLADMLGAALRIRLLIIAAFMHITPNGEIESREI
jgi:hypothetical protein